MYKAPIQDLTFALQSVAKDMPSLAQALPDSEMIDVILTEAGKLAGGKATGEAIAIATQEGIAQGITNSCTGEICE